MPRRFAVVTTAHAAGWTRYGATMARSFERCWPAEVPLLFYHQGFAPEPLSPRIHWRDLLASAPGLAAFKARHGGRALATGRSWWPRLDRRRDRDAPPGPVRWLRRGYRWDAVRFAHKSFAIFDAARRCDADVLIWIDADTRFFAPVTLDRLEALIPDDRFVAYLGRATGASDGGFVAYNLRRPATRILLNRLERLYVEDGLFALREFHDSYLFDMIRRGLERDGHQAHDIAGGTGQVLAESALGAFMDHLEDGRKRTGPSGSADLIGLREEGYWIGRNAERAERRR